MHHDYACYEACTAVTTTGGAACCGKGFCLTLCCLIAASEAVSKQKKQGNLKEGKKTNGPDGQSAVYDMRRQNAVSCFH